ncbi:uncharacterized protein EDB91DRAFT_1084367 [Suillus paluster]|uniref:uncharacterized protein n=1 Tax=Suillus paluster TaxID=48578 RepID=UPI001B8697C1|nr:uncharacterized protein EDB91DRAFT_1084367 [Suillus paluster]KAG1733642.1 hypothetical protein EDB91DRAFT_1084367 [Suillus paluster]
MTFISSDPSWWPLIPQFRGFSYFVVASSAAVIYDWALTFGQEFELIWRQRWSLVTLLYLSVRYIGILYVVIQVIMTTIALGFSGNTMNSTLNGVILVVNAMLGIIMIARLYAMYQRSRGMLIFLVAIFFTVTITCGVITAMGDANTSGEEFIILGIHQCIYGEEERDTTLADSVAWALYLAWEVLALCLAVWIVVKHVRELQRISMGWTIGDCFMVLIKTHVVYFASSARASFAVVCGFQLSHYSPTLKYRNMATGEISTGTLIYTELLEIASIVQMFVLGPRLILSIREYHAKLVASSDAETGISTIAFQERMHVSTGGGV